MIFNWVEQEQTLSAASLTVRAQAVPVNDQGTLLWDLLFPRQDVDSVKLRSISTAIFRPVADRREWNARGRLIPLVTPRLDEIEMTPIESYFRLAEREIQELEERTFGNEALFRQIVGVDIPTRTEGLASANYRRLEVDAMTAWALGQITARNPIGGDTVTVSFGFDSSRYQTPAAWTGGAGGTAYNNFIAWLRDAQVAVGAISGVMLRQSTRLAIQTSAPNAFALAGTGATVNRAQLTDLIQQETGSPFQFVENERTVDVMTDGGVTTVRTNVWPAHHIAIIPQGGRVGFTAFAPVARAYQVARGVPNAGIDVRGQTAFTEVENGGRGLLVECQGNMLPIPNEQSVYVADVGI